MGIAGNAIQTGLNQDSSSPGSWMYPPASPKAWIWSPCGMAQDHQHAGALTWDSIFV